MAINRTDIAAHLERSVRTQFLISQRDAVKLRDPFCGSTTSAGAFEMYADMGVQPWPVQNAGKQGDGGEDGRTGATEVSKINSGGPITVLGGEERAMKVNNLDWEIAVGVTHNAINDDQAGDLEAWASDAAQNFEKHKDKIAFDALNSGEANTNYGDAYDSLTLFNNSHFDKGAEYQTVQDNLYSLDLTMDNYEQVFVAGSKFRDGRGEPVGLNHSLLIVPPDLKRKAVQITDNPMEFDTGNNNINAFQGSSHLTAPGAYLDSTSWFIVDPSWTQKPMYIQTRQEPELSIVDDEFAGDGGVRYFIWKARYVLFYANWRLVLQGKS